MSIIERILNVMENKKIKMTDLSKELGIGKSVVTNWKMRGTNPPVEKLVQICEFIDEDVIYILTGEKSINIEKLTPEEQKIVEMYNQLTEKNKGKTEMFIEQKIEEQRTEFKSKDSQSYMNSMSS